MSVVWGVTRKTLIFPLLAGAIFAAGCGGGDEPATKPAAAKPAAETAATVVELTGSTFAPETVDVKAGDTISFVNKDEIAHTATASGTFDSGSMAAGARVQLHGREGRPDQLRLRVPSRHDRDDQRHLVPSEAQISTLVRTLSTTASVNSVVVACPPRSTVLVPVATASSTDS